jgi:hypothetical protein
MLSGVVLSFVILKNMSWGGEEGHVKEKVAKGGVLQKDDFGRSARKSCRPIPSGKTYS